MRFEQSSVFVHQSYGEGKTTHDTVTEDFLTIMMHFSSKGFGPETSEFDVIVCYTYCPRKKGMNLYSEQMKMSTDLGAQYTSW